MITGTINLGVLTLQADNTTEEYALQKWAEEAHLNLRSENVRGEIGGFRGSKVIVLINVQGPKCPIS